MTIPLNIHHDRHPLVHPAIADLIDAHPLAWVTSHTGDTSIATPLPIVGDYDSEGRLAALIGHFSLANRHVAALRANPRAMILFSGPQAYVSPKHVADRRWAPTWNYSVARFDCRIAFDADANDAALRRLTDKMEAMFGNGWTVDEVGSPRYDVMKTHIIAFRAEILACDATFKLGQDERDGDFATITAGLEDQALVTWMKRARGGKPRAKENGPMKYRVITGASKLALLGLALAFAGPLAAKEADLPKAADILRWQGDAQVSGFRNIDRIFPVRVVKRGPKVRPLPHADKQIAPVLSYEGNTVPIDEYMSRERVSGLLVISHGKIVLEKYGLGQKADDRWISFSIAKSVTSTLLGAAIQDGKIKSVDDLVTTYISELKGSAYDGVTLRQVLAMRSGAQWNEDYTDPNSDVGQLAASMAENKGASLVKMMAGRARGAEPGSRFLYSTGESNMVGLIVSRAVGEPLADYLSRKIWAPYGFESDASWLTDGGIEIGGCCLNITLRDYGRLGQFMLDGGKAGDAPLLPAGWIDDATRSSSAPGETPYGYQWWIPAPGTYAALGIFGQAVYVDPSKQLVVAQIAAWPDASGPQYSARRLALVEAVGRSLDAR